MQTLFIFMTGLADHLVPGTNNVTVTDAGSNTCNTSAVITQKWME